MESGIRITGVPNPIITQIEHLFMRKINIFALAFSAVLFPMFATSCLGDDVVDYTEWREQNDAYINQLNKNEYQTVLDDWAPQNPVYMKWHNDRSLTADELSPMANSTVNCIYELTDIEGTLLDRSYNSYTGDSIYTCLPQNSVIGFQVALMNMHVGDSVTVVIPYVSGYGATKNGSIRPYTNLIFGLKLKSIEDLLKPNL